MKLEEYSILAVSAGGLWGTFERNRVLNLTFLSRILAARRNSFNGRSKKGRWPRKKFEFDVFLLFFKNSFQYAACCYDFTGSTHFARGLCGIWYQKSSSKPRKWFQWKNSVLTELKSRSMFGILETKIFYAMRGCSRHDSFGQFIA